jgi:predicted nucleic acid-binding protein
MNKIFVDTSGWANFFDTDEPFHRLTRTIYENARNSGARLVTTNYVIAELVSLLTSPFRISRPRIIEYVDVVKQSPSVDLVHIDHGLDNQAWKLLTDRNDKNWSLVDCSSFVVMQNEGITESLTTDHHFEQAGFVRLLK